MKSFTEIHNIVHSLYKESGKKSDGMWNKNLNKNEIVTKLVLVQNIRCQKY
jgi:endonuclease III-like uncharacterized protein